MKIGIVGLGYVGSAVAYAHQNHNLVIRDPKLKDSAELSAFTDCDAVYICVPSPANQDGSCDSSILENAVKELLFATISNPNLVVISKTTAPPSVYEKLHRQYPNLVHCPEFITAANHIVDYQNSSYFVFGGQKDWCERARDIVRSVVPLVHEKLMITDIKTASLYKYMMNSYLAAKVTFMNDFKFLADAEGIDFKTLTDLSIWDDRIGYTHLQVPGNDSQYGWGGACFPKDISAIIMEAIDLNVDFELMDRVETINKKHRKL
jgi:UDPglucose 6-dehydrogenase